MSDVTTTPEQQLRLALQVLRETQGSHTTYDYIREAYAEQALATRLSWAELGKHLQEAISRVGSTASRE